MDDLVRLEKALYAKLKMKQASFEYDKAKRELEKLLTISEAKGNFEWELSSKLMQRLSTRADLDFKKEDYVKSSVTYKDVEIYLHDSFPLGSEALKHIMGKNIK